MASGVFALCPSPFCAIAFFSKTISLSMMISSSVVFVPPAIICQAFFLTFAIVVCSMVYRLGAPCPACTWDLLVG